MIRLHVDTIRQTGRVAQGVKLIDIAKRNDVISSVCVVNREEDEEAEVEENATELPEVQPENGEAPVEEAGSTENTETNNE